VATGSSAGSPPLLSIAFDRGQLAAIRESVRRLAARQGLVGSRLDGFILAVNEIVTNAVAHGGGRGRLRLWRSGAKLTCEVSDDGPGIPDEHLNERPRPAPTALNGRGLWLARQLCDLVSIVPGPSGTTVRIVSALPG
jgi:anti-sigma regulatory factor (Ser/Thr protein kinase)